MSDENNNENKDKDKDKATEAEAGGADVQSLVDQMQDMGDTAAAGAETKADAKASGEIKAGDVAADVSNDRNLDLILDIPLKVSAELGRTKMLVSDLLNLGQGSVVELNKLAGEALEILVNDKIIAKGEAVVVNEKFGVRLTDIISPMERVQQLK